MYVDYLGECFFGKINKNVQIDKIIENIKDLKIGDIFKAHDDGLDSDIFCKITKIKRNGNKTVFMYEIKGDDDFE